MQHSVQILALVGKSSKTQGHQLGSVMNSDGGTEQPIQSVVHTWTHCLYNSLPNSPWYVQEKVIVIRACIGYL